MKIYLKMDFPIKDFKNRSLRKHKKINKRKSDRKFKMQCIHLAKHIFIEIKINNLSILI